MVDCCDMNNLFDFCNAFFTKVVCYSDYMGGMLDSVMKLYMVT